jgi:hypothetical protein
MDWYYTGTTKVPLRYTLTELLKDNLFLSYSILKNYLSLETLSYQGLRRNFGLTDEMGAKPHYAVSSTI